MHFAVNVHREHRGPPGLPNGESMSSSISGDNALLGEPSGFGGDAAELLPEDLYARLAPYLERARNGEAVETEISTAAEDGQTRRLKVWLRPFDGDERGIFAFAVDVTERASRRLLASERFAAIAETMTALAHESRNALQRIQSCLTLLQLRSESSETQELIDDMQGAQDHLQRLYDEVNKFAAPMLLRPGIVDLGVVLNRAWSETESMWQAKRLQFSCVDHTGGASVSVDPERIGQVFRNLFENAIDASAPDGRIRAVVTLEQIDARPAVRVVVEDAGAGIPADVRERAFDLLFTTKRDGTGMGLAIARRIVDEHGGAIRLDSVPGQGTAVTVLLPCEQVADIEAPEAPGADQHSRHRH